MVNPVMLSFTLIFAATVASSLYDASANRELARSKKLVEITHDQILEENVPIQMSKWQTETYYRSLMTKYT